MLGDYKIKNIVFILLLFLSSCHSSGDSDKNPFILHHNNEDRIGNLIFVSDTQEPIWAETLIISRNRNIFARQMIFREIRKENPAKVIHLGDIVAMGFKDSEWNPIDKFLRALIEEGSGFYPTMGNHELLLFPHKGEENFEKRFPFFSPTGYLADDGALQVILLNSNFSHLSEKDRDKQQRWYRTTLNRLQQDSTVKAVIVGCHHSPFTNSKIVSPNENVQRLFVPAFIETPKCKLFVSGHAHAFEHFKYKNKDFLVIGGGGGLQQPLYIGEDEKYKDIYDSTSEKRMFHFIKVNAASDTLKITLNMIKKDFSGFNSDYNIRIPLK